MWLLATVHVHVVCEAGSAVLIQCYSAAVYIGILVVHVPMKCLHPCLIACKYVW